MPSSFAAVERGCLPPALRSVCDGPCSAGWQYTVAALTSLLQCKQARKNWADFGQVAPGVSNGQSEIRIDKLEFHRPRNVASQYGPDEGWTGLIQAVIFEVNDRDKIGYSAPDGYRYCCTKELVPKTKCHLNRLIYKVPSLPYLLSIKLHHHNYTNLHTYHSN